MFGQHRHHILSARSARWIFAFSLVAAVALAACGQLPSLGQTKPIEKIGRTLSRNRAPDAKKNKLKPWLVKEWCLPDITPEFLAAMEDLLEWYAHSFEKGHPLVCFGAKSVELHGETRPALPAEPGHPKRRDYEYQRNGTRNVFLFVEPHAGQRHTLVTRRRTKEDFAKAMRYLVDELYPEAPVIELVLDNSNTHTPDVLIEIWGEAEADRILSHLRFHYTPVHGSWLNMAESELSVSQRPCQNRRLGDEFTLGTELVAWEEPRNAASVTIHWKFTKDDARRVFAKYYPAISSC